MTEDLFDDPDAQAWAQRAVDELAPMIRDSAVTISIAPRGDADVKFAVELGFSIMMDKPIILAISPGQHVPAHLARVADEIVEVDWDHPQSSQSAIGAAMRRHVRDADGGDS